MKIKTLILLILVGSFFQSQSFIDFKISLGNYNFSSLFGNDLETNIRTNLRLNRYRQQKHPIELLGTGIYILGGLAIIYGIKDKHLSTKKRRAFTLAGIVSSIGGLALALGAPNERQ